MLPNIKQEHSDIGLSVYFAKLGKKKVKKKRKQKNTGSRLMAATQPMNLCIEFGEKLMTEHNLVK